MDHLKDVLTSIAALAAGLVGFLKYFDYKSNRDKLLQIRETFNVVVKSLSSQAEVERMAAAILLRRFFDEKSEVGIAHAPYSREAVDVSAALLRGQATGNFQKLLADGLAFAPSLARTDLQRTNLQFAYLGSRTKGEGATAVTVTTNLKHADFYRADLSSASLKKADARGAVFYQARMHGTVLSGADLRDGYFFEADLKGAKFDGALLSGANFRCARNVPPALAEHLGDADVYTGADPFQPPKTTDESPPVRVFISKPGCVSDQQQRYISNLLTLLQPAGIEPLTLERRDYPDSGIFQEVQRILNDCAGAVIFGFKELEVREAVWRAGTSEERVVQNQSSSTPWTQIEAGMANMLGLPLLVISQEQVSGGVFDTASVEYQVYQARVDEDWTAPAFRQSFADWSADVRERSRSLTR
jgi:pentapeptide repeat protein